MKNLTNHGKYYLSKYLRDYQSGLLSGVEVMAYLDVCFSDL